ncbi:hypothetical protein QQ045_024428 [Rhodiola kirilowii]
MSIIPKVVTDEMNDLLLAPFTEAKVKRALFQMHPTKAPGLDGLSALFYQSNWETVRGDVLKEVLKCLNEGILNHEINETLIVLIPKVHKVERVEELRPISLCNVIMKIITKVLANRLKTFLPNIISPSQSAFIQGRLITDNIIVAHEVSHFLKGRNSQKTGYLSLKLDLSKAFDRVDWRFLKEIMLKMDFDEAWVSKVMMFKSAYRLAVKLEKLKQPPVGEQSDSKETQRFWKGLWRLNLPPRVKLFGWRLYYDSLPTKRNLLRRGCECDSPGYWLWLCVRISSEDQFRTLLCGLWFGWRVRNDLVHGKESYDVELLQLKLRFLLKEFKGRAKNQPWILEGTLERLPDQVISCDGAYDPESRIAGFGVTVSQHRRIVNARAGWVSNISSSFEAECKALRVGMEMALEQKLEKVLFCSDSREVIWALSLGTWRSGMDVRLLKECLDLLDEHQSW